MCSVSIVSSGRKIVNAGVVDQDVHSAELFLGFIRQLLRIFRLREVGVYRDGLSACLRNLVYYTVCAFLARRVIHYHLRALTCQPLRNRRPNALRSPVTTATLPLNCAITLILSTFR